MWNCECVCPLNRTDLPFWFPSNWLMIWFFSPAWFSADLGRGSKGSGHSAWLSSSILAALHQTFSPLQKLDSLIFPLRKKLFFILNWPHVLVTTLLQKCLYAAADKQRSSPSKHSSRKGCTLPPSILSLISRLAWGITWAKLLIWFHTFPHSSPAAEVG